MRIQIHNTQNNFCDCHVDVTSTLVRPAIIEQTLTLFASAISQTNF